MNSINDKVTVIIRSVGERTEQLCQALTLAQGICPANVVIVRESPFSAAMRESFAVGIERGRPWTLCNDADVLLRPGAVAQMVQLAEQQAENTCEIQGYILDKYYGGPRQGGVHLYRTALLPESLASIPAEGLNIRPESHTLEAMKAKGYPWVTVPYWVGLHDFEQYYRDIFRKCFVHAHKHQQSTELFLAIWRDGAADDVDYRVALHGFAAGIAHYDNVRIDTRQEIYQTQFAALQIAEKEELPAGNHSLDAIEHIITTWVELEPYRRHFPTQMGLVALDRKPAQALQSLSARERFSRRQSDVGTVRMLPYLIGWLLRRTGTRIQEWASSQNES